MSRRRGACPSIFAPMSTGDGLLVRLPRPMGGLTPNALTGLAELATRTGNGSIDITARGNIQIRGVCDTTLALLREGLDALELLPLAGPAIETNALLGVDPAISGDTAGISAAIRTGAADIAAPLAPKLTILVDGGGALPLDAQSADIRLRATEGGWHLALAGTAHDATPLGHGDRARAVEAALRLVRAIAALGPTARATTLAAADMPALGLDDGPPPAPQSMRDPIGRVALPGGESVGLGLPFGRIDAPALALLAEAAGASGAYDIRPAPGQVLLVTGLRPAALDMFTQRAAGLGLVTSPDDPRRRVQACAGRPGCASAHLDTRALAGLVARRLSDSAPDGGIVHISGCEKGCAHPRAAMLVLAGTPDGCALIRDGRAGSPPERLIPFDALGDLASRGLLFESRP